MSRASGPTDPELIRFLREELGETIPTAAAIRFTAPLWQWRGKASDGTPAKGAWYFITIDGEAADIIRAAAPGRSAAWGSVSVEARIGATSWRTSVFPSKESGGYLLPVKASVRKAERLAEHDLVAVSLSI